MKFATIVAGFVTVAVTAVPLSAQRIQGDAWRLGRFETGFGVSAWNYSPTTSLFLAALRREKVVAPDRFERAALVAAPTRGPGDIAATAGPSDVLPPPPPPPAPDPVLPTTTVPEPATMALLATGLLLLGAAPFARRLRQGR